VIDDTDILIGEDGDIGVENGDLAVGFCTGQEAKFIIEHNMGDWKRQPLICVGIKDYVKKAITPSVGRRLEQSTRVNFALDGKELNDMELIVDEAGKLLKVNVDCE
jgi:hypothetical protein